MRRQGAGRIDESPVARDFTLLPFKVNIFFSMFNHPLIKHDIKLEFHSLVPERSKILSFHSMNILFSSWL